MNNFEFSSFLDESEEIKDKVLMAIAYQMNYLDRQDLMYDPVIQAQLISNDAVIQRYRNDPFFCNRVKSMHYSVMDAIKSA